MCGDSLIQHSLQTVSAHGGDADYVEQLLASRSVVCIPAGALVAQARERIHGWCGGRPC